MLHYFRIMFSLAVRHGSNTFDNPIIASRYTARMCMSTCHSLVKCDTASISLFKISLDDMRVYVIEYMPYAT